MKKVYASIIDQILDDNAPSYENTSEEKKNGDAFRALSKDKSDTKFLEGIAGKSHHTVVPSSGVVANQEDWRDRNEKVLDDDSSVLASAIKAASGESIENLEKKMLSDTEVKKRIDDMLHLGFTPDKVKSNLDKIAELAIFNRTLSADYLDDRSGLVGLSYIEPNHFMKSSGSQGCVESFNKINREGSIKAASVKKISACDSCSHCKNGRCNLYKLPIVASKKDLLEVVDTIASKAGKKATKIAMVSIHNGTLETEEVKAPRLETEYTVRSAGDKATYTENSISSEDFRDAIEGGKTFAAAFVEARARFGTLKVKTAAKKYIEELKKTGSKIDLNKVDCKFLGAKLASKNAIIGASKCASCSYRNGMHCGLTGGTLLTFPGLDKVQTNKNASENVKYDGNSLNEQVGLDSSKPQDFEVEINEIKPHEVDLGQYGNVGDIE